MPFRTPSSPGGMVTLTPSKCCSPSLRENVTLNGLNAPACGLAVPAANPGANSGAPHPPPPGPWATSKDAEGVAGGPDCGADHGVIVEPTVKVPHAGGVFNAAVSPPKK